jgi:predicted phage terminase large subunit-like protein
MTTAMLDQVPALDDVDAELARRSLLDFTTFTYPNYRPNWHHIALCQALDRFIAGETRFLMIFLPAQNGKSELVSRRLPSYLLGSDPDARIIACSYSADLASAMNRDVQRIMESERYRMVFPHTQIPGENTRTLAGRPLRNNDIFEIVGRRGYYKCAGVGGSITGRSADVAIIDDPIKNRAEAESQTYRDGLWEWYGSTLRQRLTSEAGRVLLCMTRWHEDDLAGRLIEAMKQPDADRWEVVRFPAIAEEPRHLDDPREIGEALWPERYPLSELAARRVVSGSYEWAGMYQQRPAPTEGGLIKRHWWKFYSVRPERFDDVLQSWDCTFKATADTDFVSGHVWGRIGADCYLLDRVHDRLTFTQTIAAVRSLSAKWPQAAAKLVEDTANGPAVIDTLSREIPGLIAVKPDGGKVARMQAVSPTIEAGNAYLPDASIAPWVQEVIEEAAVFPNGAYDDDCDAMSQALRRLMSPPVPAPAGATLQTQQRPSESYHAARRSRWQ